MPPATRDGRAFLNWNFDLPRWWRNFMGHFPFYVRRIKGCKPYLCVDHSFMGLPHAAQARTELEYEPDPATAYRNKTGRGHIFTRPLSDPPLAGKMRGMLMAYVAKQDQSLMSRVEQ